MTESNPYGISDNAAGGIAYLTAIPAIAFLLVEPFKRTPLSASIPGNPSSSSLPGQ